jgi:hypothetical protein
MKIDRNCEQVNAASERIFNLVSVALTAVAELALANSRQRYVVNGVNVSAARRVDSCSHRERASTVGRLAELTARFNGHRHGRSGMRCTVVGGAVELERSVTS